MFFPRCISFSPEIIRMTLFVFTRPFFHIYFTIYHIWGAYIYLVLLGCFNPFTVWFLPKQFTLYDGAIAALKKLVLSTFHSSVASLFLSLYISRKCLSKLKLLPLLVRSVRQVASGLLGNGLASYWLLTLPFDTSIYLVKLCLIVVLSVYRHYTALSV